MRVLQSCDFCAADAAGTFEVIPSELNPTDAEQRRVLLCPDCADRLEHLLEPLLKRAGAEDGRSTHADPPSESVDDTADSSHELSASVDNAESTPDPIALGPRESEATDEQASTDAQDDGDSDRNSGSDQSSAEDADEDTAVGKADAARDDETATASTAAAAETATTAAPTTEQPKAYAKVMRLLRNRDLPMERTTVETIAGGAYDLEPHEARALIEYAIDEGRLREDGDRVDWA